MDAVATSPGDRSRPRPTWAELPHEVRAGIEGTLGARVSAATSTALGLTPGLASRAVLEDGRRVFLKAAGVHRGASVVEKIRSEARVLAALPPRAPAPELLAHYDDGRWAALACTDVDGRPPALPWRRDDLDRVLAALTVAAEAATPSPLPQPRFVADWGADLAGWRQLAGATGVDWPAQIDPWARKRLELLARLEAGWAVVADGDTLLHGDLRADNLLLTDERVFLVDWPSASTGAAWLDLVFLLPGVAVGEGPDPEDVVTTHPLTRDLDPAALTAMVAAVAGFLVTVGMEPPPWYAPEVRAFQLAEGAAAVRWLRRRLGE